MHALAHSTGFIAYFVPTFCFLNALTTIRKGIAGFLLALLFLSATPKQFLHKALANHTDNVADCKHRGKPCLHQAGFNCHFDTLVVNTGYVFHAASPSAAFQTLLPLFFAPTFPAPLKDFVHLWSNKGPPAVA